MINHRARSYPGRFDRKALCIKFGIVGKNIILRLDIGIHLLRRQNKGIGTNIARDNIAAVLGIEAANLFNGELQHIGYLFEMYPARHLHRIGEKRAAGEHGTDIVVAIIVHHIVDCNKGRHIATGLARQIGIDFPIVGLATRTTYRLAHITGATVVRSDGERPIVIDAIQVFEITGGHGRRLDGVTALVDKTVYLESHALAGLDHELPQPGSSRARSGIRTQGRLDDGQVFQFERKPLPLESLFEDWHIIGAQPQQIFDESPTFLYIHIDVTTHHAVVGHLDDGGELRQFAHINRVGIVDIHAVFETRVIDNRILLHIPVGKQTVQVGLHAFGIHLGAVVQQDLDRVTRHLGRIRPGILPGKFCLLGKTAQRQTQTC